MWSKVGLRSKSRCKKRTSGVRELAYRRKRNKLFLFLTTNPAFTLMFSQSVSR